MWAGKLLRALLIQQIEWENDLLKRKLLPYGRQHDHDLSDDGQDLSVLQVVVVVAEVECREHNDGSLGHQVWILA